MRMGRSCLPRRGANTVEFAISSGAAFLLLVGLIVGARGVFRYQEVAHLAREGARYAATHGGQYHKDGIDTKTGVPQVIATSDVAAYVLPQGAMLDPNHLTVTASWSAPANVVPRNIPTYGVVDSSTNPPNVVKVRNYVTVTVTYQWLPEAYFVGPITLTSTSTIPMSY